MFILIFQLFLNYFFHLFHIYHFIHLQLSRSFKYFLIFDLEFFSPLLSNHIFYLEFIILHRSKYFEFSNLLIFIPV